MPYPSRLNVKTRFRAILDDPNGLVWLDSPYFSEGFTEAYDALFNALLNSQAPRLELIVDGIHIIPGTKSWNPATDGGITDLADYVRIEERPFGSVQKFTEMYSWDQLPQRDPTDRIVDYVYRFDTFYFVGVTSDRELRITYESSGTAPAADGTIITVDGSLSFLAKAAVAAVAKSKGRDELGAQCRKEAYGPRYDDTGVPGGELLRIIAPRVRAEQKTPMAIKPYSVYRSRLRRRVPYVVAQQPQGIGQAPAQFSTATGTITPAPDGVTTVFFLSYPVVTAVISRNGLIMTQPTDCTFATNMITFSIAQTPQVGDIVTAQGWT